jgi:hypothetical protein
VMLPINLTVGHDTPKRSNGISVMSRSTDM